MNNRQQAREEALFVLLMEQVARQQDRQARQLGRALEEDPEAALSPALQQRCMQTLRRGFRRRDRQAAGRTTRRVMSRVAVAVLAAVLCLTAAFAVSPTLRGKALHWAAKVFPTHTELRLNPDAAPANGQTYEPVVNWLPVGLTLEEQRSDRGFSNYHYTDSDGCWLDVELLLFSSGGVMSLDTENADVRETVISGYPAITIRKEGVSVAACTLEDLNGHPAGHRPGLLRGRCGPGGGKRPPAIAGPPVIPILSPPPRAPSTRSAPCARRIRSSFL